jgi:hypothetical protein
MAQKDQNKRKIEVRDLEATKDVKGGNSSSNGNKKPK